MRKILGVFAGHGFGEVLARIDLLHYVPGLKRRRKTADDCESEGLTREESVARRVRMALEELGPTFVKLGQMLAGRPDLMDEAHITELGKLREDVKPFPFEEVRARVEQELGGTLEEVFKDFDHECIASGSIAQVHKAVTTEGDSVVVKVKRPGIDKVVMTDVELMTQIAVLIEKHVPELAVLHPKTVAEEFGRGIMRELDLISEAAQTQRFAQMFEDNVKIVVPVVYWEYTTTNVLTLERLTGKSVASIEREDDPDVDKRQLARQISEFFMEQFFEKGMFHADPHGGNLFVMGDGVLGVLDFGLVGRLTEEMKDQLSTVMVAVVQGDVEVIADVCVDMGVLGEAVDSTELRGDIRDILDRYYGIPLRFVDTRQLFLDVMASVRKHGATIPREFVMLSRAFSIVEGLARTLDPDIDIREVAEPYARRLAKNRLAPKRIAHRASRYLWQLARIANRAPKVIAKLLNQFMAGKLGISVEHRGMENFTLELERASNRLAFSIILAGIIVGSSLVLTTQAGPMLYGMPLMGVIGFCAAGVLGFWILLAILRRGRL